MPRTIIVPVDLSQQAAAVRALAEARQYDPDGKLMLLHVVPPLPNYVATELPDDIVKSRLEQVQQALRGFVQRAGMVEVDAVIREGHPGREILNCADETDADLIVVASHDPGWGDFLLGSVAAFVVRHAHCSVFVVRWRHGESTAG